MADEQPAGRVARIKAAQDALAARSQGGQRGLYLVHSGAGKGKTSAALNLVYRHLAHGRRAAVVQFVKCREDFPDGDRIMLERLAALGMPVSIAVLGRGFTWNSQDPAADRAAAGAAWSVAETLLADPVVDLVVLDELHIALKHRQLDLDPVIQAIRARPPTMHVVSTGRDAPAALIDLADLVTEFCSLKHPLAAGVPAQTGIEF